MFTLAQAGLSTPPQRGEGDTDPFTHCPNTEFSAGQQAVELTVD